MCNGVSCEESAGRRRAIVLAQCDLCRQTQLRTRRGPHTQALTVQVWPPSFCVTTRRKYATVSLLGRDVALILAHHENSVPLLCVSCVCTAVLAFAVGDRCERSQTQLQAVDRRLTSTEKAKECTEKDEEERSDAQKLPVASKLTHSARRRRCRVPRTLKRDMPQSSTWCPVQRRRDLRRVRQRT